MLKAVIFDLDGTLVQTEIMKADSYLDFMASRDDVEHSKPDPEIYCLVAKEFDLDPQSCLVIEDSLSGVQAALAAGMHCIAVTTDFTYQSVKDSGILDEQLIVSDPRGLMATAEQFFSQ